jgi:NAD(P)-dependent dehydrogenase (short-subunit alcohol dehydrogenase family)
MPPESQGNPSWLQLEGQVCVVTGAGSGIGAATARRLAAAGAHVALLDRDPGAAEAVAAGIRFAGGHALGLQVNVSSEKDVTQAAAHVTRELGLCRVLVNNAAARLGGSLVFMPLENWNQLLAVNLTGALLCTQVFAQHMIAGGRGGSVIHIGSITGHNPSAKSGAYSVSKAGMGMLSRVLSLELGTHGIRSNVISPGLVRTPATEAAYRDADVLNARTAMIPMGRISQPTDIADAILYLASERSSYITGQDIVVDGGLSQSLMGQVPHV